MITNRTHIVRLGDYIEPRVERNTRLQYGVDKIEGVTSSGVFAPTKANTDGINLKPYKVVRRGDFAYNPSRLNIGSIAYYTGQDFCIVSHLYHIFHIREDKKSELLPEYLSMYFKRGEFLRLVDYLNYGSQRAEFSYNQFAELEIPLPSIEEQRAIVGAWKAIRSIREQSEAMAIPIEMLCQSYIQECKHKYEAVELRQYIEECNNRNRDLEFGDTDLMGVKSDGTFINSIADKSELKFHNYKIVRVGEFCYSNRINIGSIAMNRGRDCIVSPSYAVFKVKEDSKDYILPEYLNIWFRRSEFLRSTLFYAFGTIKDDFSIENMKQVRLPLPPIKVQQAIVSVYQCALEYRAIAAGAAEQAGVICPALLQHAIHS